MRVSLLALAKAIYDENSSRFVLFCLFCFCFVCLFFFHFHFHKTGFALSLGLKGMGDFQTESVLSGYPSSCISV